MMYTMRAARGPYVNDMYFIFVVMFGSLFMLNLVVAVLVANFDADREKEDKRGSFIPPEGVSPKDEKRPEAPPSAIAAMATTTRQQSRRAAACGRAELLAQRGHIGRVQNPVKVSENRPACGTAQHTLAVCFVFEKLEKSRKKLVKIWRNLSKL